MSEWSYMITQSHKKMCRELETSPFYRLVLSFHDNLNIFEFKATIY